MVSVAHPVAAFTGGGATITSAGFDVVTGDVIVVDCHSDSTHNFVCSNSGTNFTWVEGGEDLNTPATGTRLCVVTENRTGLTVTMTTGSINSAGIISVYSGLDSADPLGAINNGTSSTGNINVGLTTTEDGNFLHVTGTEWGAGTLPTSSDCVEIAAIYNVGGSAFGGITAYREIDPAGAATNNISIGGGGAAWVWAATELRVAPQAPNPPVALFATAGDGRIFLDWDAPTVDGGSAITDYLIETSANGTSGWSTVSEGTSTTTEHLMTGQTNGVAQYFRVSAINAIGTSSPSNVIGPATPRTAYDYKYQEDGTNTKYTEDSDEREVQE